MVLGWVCPRCECVWAPGVPYCQHCSQRHPQGEQEQVVIVPPEKVGEFLEQLKKSQGDGQEKPPADVPGERAYL
jgi:hypothetical protein